MRVLRRAQEERHSESDSTRVFLAKARIQIALVNQTSSMGASWFPAFAGMTGWGLICHSAWSMTYAHPSTGSGARHAVPLENNQDGPGNYRPCFMKSLTCSPITIVVTLVLARMQSGIMEASTTLNPVTPCTLPY